MKEFSQRLVRFKLKYTNKIAPKNLYFRTLISAKKVPIDKFDFERALKIFFEGKK